MALTRFLRHAGIAVLATTAILTFSATRSPASAGAQNNLGLGFGLPVYPGVGLVYSDYGHGYSSHHHRYRHHHHRPYARSYYRPYYPYYPPPVVYAPSVVYAPPPVVYAPRVTYTEPLRATPTSDIYRANNGQYCREYQSTARINGRLQNTYGTACQDAGGVWRVVN
tara:strand:+ start:72074 stop:72574 length:501 start_codon:yes stop_codon:yes gene_type:complete